MDHWKVEKSTMLWEKKKKYPRYTDDVSLQQQVMDEWGNIRGVSSMV